MPAEARGSVYATSRGYGVRWYDEHGIRRRKAGFKSKSEARNGSPTSNVRGCAAKRSHLPP
jgi:hypothetical protein